MSQTACAQNLYVTNLNLCPHLNLKFQPHYIVNRSGLATLGLRFIHCRCSVASLLFQRALFVRLPGETNANVRILNARMRVVQAHPARVKATEIHEIAIGRPPLGPIKSIG